MKAIYFHAQNGMEWLFSLRRANYLRLTLGRYFLLNNGNEDGISILVS